MLDLQNNILYDYILNYSRFCIIAILFLFELQVETGRGGIDRTRPMQVGARVLL